MIQEWIFYFLLKIIRRGKTNFYVDHVVNFYMKVCEAHGNKYLKEARISCESRILAGWGFLFICAQTEYMVTCNSWFKVLGFGIDQKKKKESTWKNGHTLMSVGKRGKTSNNTTNKIWLLTNSSIKRFLFLIFYEEIRNS